MIASPAAAHPNGWVTDGNPHRWCYGDSTVGYPTLRDSMAYAINNLDSQTEVNSPDSEACSAEVDIKFARGSADGGRGLWQCVQYYYGSVDICYRSTITINTIQIQNDGGPYELNLRKTTCHEVGHSVGLDHHAIDCMISGPIASGHQTYAPEHVGAINYLI